jgi:hypothetical protein
VGEGDPEGPRRHDAAGWHAASRGGSTRRVRRLPRDVNSTGAADVQPSAHGSHRGLTPVEPGGGTPTRIRRPVCCARQRRWRACLPPDDARQRLRHTSPTLLPVSPSQMERYLFASPGTSAGSQWATWQ